MQKCVYWLFNYHFNELLRVANSKYNLFITMKKIFQQQLY